MTIPLQDIRLKRVSYKGGVDKLQKFIKAGDI